MPSPARILVVDDDPGLREALVAALAPPYEVLTAGTGMDALVLIGREPLDLIILDYVLPDLSGLTLLRIIKKVFPSVLIVVITAFGSEEVCVESFRGGARDYLNKPIRLPELRARVNELLAARAACVERRSPVLPVSRPGHPNGRPISRETSLERALAYIDGHLDAPLTLDGVSREAGMSKFHFCRHFKSFTGLTFREYLARRRIGRATDLLRRDPERSVTETYLDLGFKDLSHFGRVFRKLIGQSPSLFRRNPGDPSFS
jgi:YesN/AraC family two-component response regulator